jgi:hypothetical protein
MKNLVLAIVLMFTVTTGYAQSIPEQLQKVSVTIKSSNSEGSGVIVTREIEGKKVNFVWTAGHVVDGLRHIRDVVDSSTGQTKKAVVFDDAAIVKELNEDGRRVGELKMDARVVSFSNPDTGDDLALLMIRKRDFIQDSAVFYLDEPVLPVGTELWHVGSLLGQMGANSCTDGVMSQIGRVYEGHVYDQSSCAGFPGSSGGGIFLKSDGRYVGMLVRGAGETFNLMVPVRRMRDWAKTNNVLWAIDPSVPMPTLAEIDKLAPEDANAIGSVPVHVPFSTRQLHTDSISIRFLNKSQCVCGDECKCEDCKCSEVKK